MYKLQNQTIFYKSSKNILCMPYADPNILKCVLCVSHKFEFHDSYKRPTYDNNDWWQLLCITNYIGSDYILNAIWEN